MSITDVISKNEKNLERLEDMTQLPKDVLNQLEGLYDEINSILEDAADEYGDEPEDEDNSEEDEWE